MRHVRRPLHNRHQPLHVTVRVRRRLPSLREQSLFGCIRQQIRAAQERFIRIVHFSVQSNHLHLIVEADDRRLLSSGMKGFGVRLARHLNRLLSSRGSVLADRYHARALSTPREARNALVYVLFNRKKHGRGAAAIDPCSSARSFDGWTEDVSVPVARGSPGAAWPLAPAKTWLLKRGWLRLGRVDLSEAPGPSGTLAARTARKGTPQVRARTADHRGRGDK